MLFLVGFGDQGQVLLSYLSADWQFVSILGVQPVSRRPARQVLFAHLRPVSPLLLLCYIFGNVQTPALIRFCDGPQGAALVFG